MGALTPLDAAVLAPAVVLGLAGVRLGLGRLVVAWPIRWLVPLAGAGLAALPASLAVAANGGLPALIEHTSTAAIALAGAIVFLVTLVMLTMFMRNLRARMAVWTGGRRTSLRTRLLGGIVGTACGLLLVAIPYELYQTLGPGQGGAPAWTRGSMALPYFRDASEAVRRALSTFLASASGVLRP